MTDDEIDELIAGIEAQLQVLVTEALDEVAAEFAAEVEAADELVAARFSVSRIADMWRRRVGPILDRLRGVAAEAAEATADELGEELPPDWDETLEAYVDGTRALLDEVGTHLSEAAVRTLAAGLNEGDSPEALKVRLRKAFDVDGSEMGPARAERIATTEATRAWNAGTLAAAQALTGPERPLVKQWTTRRDNRVRESHNAADGQLRLLDEPFDVGGNPMQYPGDPAAPADQTINCRCVLRTATATERTASMTEEITASVHTGAMIALVPSALDAAYLALTEGGEQAEELHVTLAFLGEAVGWDDEHRQILAQRLSDVADVLPVLDARLFGAACWNPAESPVWVWSVGDGESSPDGLTSAMRAARDAYSDLGPVPAQHSPWVAHMTAAYGEGNRMAELTSRLGGITFDRLRLAFGGEVTDFPLYGTSLETLAEPVAVTGESEEVQPERVYDLVPWSTPGDAALAFENQQTGDGRVFTPGALYWNGPGPWPLQYADEMNGGHDGARLAGCIESMGRDGDRITGYGALYMNTSAGVDAAMMLSQGAPLGVSVDLDDVDMELVDATGESYTASLAWATLLPLAEGGFVLTGETVAEWTASGVSLVGESRKMMFTVGADGLVPGSAFELSAAAGDPARDGTVVETQRAGDFLMRITRARVRGATLVSIPAYDRARIVLDDMSADGLYASADAELTADAANNDFQRVVRHVRKSLNPVTVASVAGFLGLTATVVRRHLAKAAKDGLIMRISRGRYVPPTGDAAVPDAGATPAPIEVKADATAVADGWGDLAAAVTGRVDLPVAERDTTWDGDAAREAVFRWADGDTGKLSQAFAYRDDDADPATKGAYKLGYATVDDGGLVIIPAGVFAAQAALEGARGGTDIPSDQIAGVRARLEEVRAHVEEVTGTDDREEMEASAWSAMKDLPAMPAAWFAEPTKAELPPGGPGVNYANGRIFGWVAQAGEPHAGMAKKITIDTLGRIDTTHFLRQRFTLDDGSSVKAGAFTMGVGHHRDGAECETAACQFDSTRTVAGIVTVGMNDRGMWFSGAAAPWLAEWDRSVFMASQPSYHMKKGGNGVWQLRAVLSVPVPGHSSPLLASAVIERSNLALTAAATMVEVEEAVAAATVQPEPSTPDIDYDRLADSMVAALARAEDRRKAESAELEALLTEASKLEL